jgi:hypothetical protein
VNAAFLMASYVVSFHLHLLFCESFQADNMWKISVVSLNGLQNWTVWGAGGLQHCQYLQKVRTGL